MNCKAVRVADETLHTAWRAGDSAAAAVLIGRYLSRIRRFGLSLGLSPELAQDLAHEVVQQAGRSRYVAREGASYWNWLTTIARRHAIRLHEAAPLPSATPVRRVTTPWSGLCREEALALLRDMPPAFKEAIGFSVVGYSSVEIAEALGVEPTVVRSRLMRGRRWLRARTR